LEIAAVLFDLGNTLTDSASLAGSLAHLAQTSVLDDLQLDGTQPKELGQQVERHIDRLYLDGQEQQPDWLNVWQSAASHCGFNLNSPEAEYLCRAHLRQFVSECTVEPITVPLLADLQAAKIPLALVSNATGPVDIFDDDLRHKGLASFFQTVVWSSSVGYRKPNPRIFQAALAGLGLSASQAILMVGDHEQADVLGGRNLGFTTIKVVNSEVETHSAADYVVARAALPDFFGRLNGGRGVASNRL